MRLDEKLQIIKKIIEDKKGQDIKILDLRELSTVCDVFVICSVDIPLQARAIADEIDYQLSDRGEYPVSVEGYEGSEWLLMDYGDVVVHIFTHSARVFYDLDRLWADAPEFCLV
ncbi:ribosome-associated protein [Thermosulfidibacter takaii ABI70S6]|uniref:Ribosomal silencing factor RsfS n=1 Tax=Thermosulfidibacter takaii (strain DSM 17441 / JCM 13301 / NBRC 103674 / ABI70S6) TaxID=1298851 RepID=A0A0S3QSQ8_THET7|nr:ribosome silencing factor [Thermosulfidibacter takaii]BAT71349.1 ribosome-associated protein [Thermosulfidibacter takaii ABI70S6]